MDRSRFSFNTGNLTGSIADKLAAIHEAGFPETTMWPADFYVHFEDLDANLEFARTSPLRNTCYMMVRDLEGSPPEVKARKMKLAANMMGQMDFIDATTLVQCSNIGPDPRPRLVGGGRGPAQPCRTRGVAGQAHRLRGHEPGALDQHLYAWLADGAGCRPSGLRARARCLARLHVGGAAPGDRPHRSGQDLPVRIGGLSGRQRSTGARCCATTASFPARACVPSAPSSSASSASATRACSRPRYSTRATVRRTRAGSLSAASRLWNGSSEADHHDDPLGSNAKKASVPCPNGPRQNERLLSAKAEFRHGQRLGPFSRP